MLEVRVAEINTWLREHKLQNEYNVKIINDPFRGKMLALYEIYSNGTQSLVAQSGDDNKIINYLSTKTDK